MTERKFPFGTTVRQKDRKQPSTLYFPEACESDLIDSTLTRLDDGNDDMKTVCKAAVFFHHCIEKFQKTKTDRESSKAVTSVSEQLQTKFAKDLWPRQH